VLDRLVYAKAKKGYELVSTHEGDATFAPPSFRGLKIPLGRLWAPPRPTAKPRKKRR
jgi:hypothetical protein